MRPRLACGTQGMRQVSTPLLKTKLYVPPIRSKLVSRPHLVSRLDDGLRQGSRLTLISAPAGYGKTTLLSEWVAHSDLLQRVAWVSLDESDNDPARFWAYVAAALQAADEDIGGIDRPPFPSLDPTAIDSVLIGLLNQITAVPDRMVLVLDDYHVIKSPAIHAALSFMLENMPPQMHLVLATRVDPPLPIPRLRGRGQLTGLFQADLRFTPEEAAEFLNRVMGLDLSKQSIAALERRTEGWIAGLQMAAVSMRNRDDVTGFVRAFTGSHYYILDYLGDEVLRQQPEEVREFLLRTGILARLNASLCSALMEDTACGDARVDSQAILEYLERSNLFVVPLDSKRGWYRYHHLFADLLRQRVSQERPGILRALHQRASTWYEKNGLMAEAVNHALGAKDFERSARLIQEAGWASFTRGEMTTILDWMAALPDDAVRSHPQLSCLHAWALAKSGQLDDVELCLRDIDPHHVHGEANAVRAYVAGVRGDLPQAVELAEQALGNLPEENLILRAIVAQNLGVAFHWSGDPAAAVRSLSEAAELSRAAGQSYQTLTALAILGRAQEMQGSLRQAMATYREALDIAAGPGSRAVPFACMAYVGLAGLLYEWNDLDEALTYVREGIRLSELGGFVAYQVFGRALLARIHEAQCDRQSARDVLRETERLREGRQYALVWALVSEVRIRWWLAEGRMAEASQWARERRLSPGDALDSGREIEQMTVARVLIAQARAASALRLLSGLLKAARAAGRMGSVIKIQVLRSLAFDAEDDRAAAGDALQDALSIAEPEGYVRTFLDEGEVMAGLLRRALSGRIVPGYAARLLAAFREEAKLTRPLTESLIEPLTDRELQVLRLVVAGLSNPDIAEELFIAVSTVKSHINHIYGKLGVESRTQAVIKAQELALL